MSPKRTRCWDCADIRNQLQNCGTTFVMSPAEKEAQDAHDILGRIQSFALR